MYELDFIPGGFEWIDISDWEKSVVGFMRKGKMSKDTITVVCNFTPVVRSKYRVGVPEGGFWREVLNSDAKEYGGSGQGNLGGVEAEQTRAHGRPYSVSLTLPPLSILVLKKVQ